MIFIKCEVCDADISDEKCIFAECKIEIDGKAHYFCCKKHADQFEKKIREKTSSG